MTLAPIKMIASMSSKAIAWTVPELTESNEHALDEDICQSRENKVVRSSSKLNVEKSPFVKSSRIRIEDICRVLVHLLRSLCNANNLESGPSQSSSHAKEEENGENNLSGRIDLGKFPQA